MKALILENFYINKMTAVLFCFLLILVSVENMLISPANIYINVLSFSAIIPAYYIVLDKRSKWEMYSRVLPVTCKQYVSSKYIISLITLTVTLGMYVFYKMMSRIFLYGVEYYSDYGLSYYFKADEIGKIVLVGFVCLMFYHAVAMFISFAINTKNNFLQLFIVIIIFLLSDLIETLGVYIAVSVDYNVEALNKVIPLIASISVYALSWLLSVKIYQKRDL